jgi:hypothetical protein
MLVHQEDRRLGRGAMPRAMRSFLAVLVPVAAAAGCAWPDAPLAGYQGVRSQIESYYDGRAMEANASCPNPEMASINGAKVVEESPTAVVMLVDYRWVDDGVTVDLGDSGSKLDCMDWSQRRFTFERSGDSLAISSMSGLQKGS